MLIIVLTHTKHQMAGKRSRGWCFTLNNYIQEDCQKVLNLEADYVVCGKEKGEAKATPHLQGYMYWKNAKAFSTVKKILPKAHWETAKGTAESNRIYCSKEEDLLLEKGTIPMDQREKGAKGSEFWNEVKEKAVNGQLEELPSKVYLQMYRTLVAVQKDHMKKCAPLAETTGEWWYGPSGSGKSKTARETYPDAYIKGVNKWWDGYRGEEVVIIEDLDKYNVSMGGDLKRWCDHYSFPAEIKGGGMNIRPKKIIITSQYDIGEIWEDKATVDALERRCKKVKFVVAGADVPAEPAKKKKDKVDFVPDEMKSGAEMDWESYYQL